MAGTVVKMADYSGVQGDYPLANTKAARMLKEALDRAGEEQSLSQRQIGKMLNYRTAVVLSHMALGRVPIPIDRVLDFARILKMDQAEFLLAVLEQRHPDIDFQRILVGNKSNLAKGMSGSAAVVADMEAMAGMSLESLPPQQLSLVKDVLADRNASRRWVSPHEAVVIEDIRKARPDVTTGGLDSKDRKKIADAISK